jgi:hypothetical protein
MQVHLVDGTYELFLCVVLAQGSRVIPTVSARR